MSADIRTTLGRLPGLLRRDAKRIEKAINKGVEKTAFKAVKPIRSRVPKAFGELSESVQGYSQGDHGGPVTSVDAPHAGAVEVGSAPHTPDFHRLVEWVKLRGLQGLTSKGQVRKRFPKSWGPTTPEQATRVASMFKARSQGGSRTKIVSDAAAEDIARAIAAGIEKHGTRPHWFVRNSLPEIREILDAEVRKSLDEVGTRSEAGQTAAYVRKNAVISDD